MRSAHQIAQAVARVGLLGGRIVREFFDVYPDRFRSWLHRSQARQLWKAVENRQREFGAVIVSDSLCAFSTWHDYDEVQFLCAEHGVQLWVPEIDEPVDPKNTAHVELMTALLWRTTVADARHLGLLPIVAAMVSHEPTSAEP